MQRVHLQLPDRRKWEVPVWGNTRPYTRNDCKWYKSTVIKCCLENAIKMHNCTFTQGVGMNNNESTQPGQHPTQFPASSSSKILIIYSVYWLLSANCTGMFNDFVDDLFHSPSHKALFCLRHHAWRETTQRSAVLTPLPAAVFTSLLLRRCPDITTAAAAAAAPPAVYHSYVPWTKVYPQSCCYQPRVYWIVLTLTHSV